MARKRSPLNNVSEIQNIDPISATRSITDQENLEKIREIVGNGGGIAEIADFFGIEQLQVMRASANNAQVKRAIDFGLSDRHIRKFAQ